MGRTGISITGTETSGENGGEGVLRIASIAGMILANKFLFTIWHDLC